MKTLRIVFILTLLLATAITQQVDVQTLVANNT